MNYRLKNKQTPTQTLCLTGESWYKILNLANEYGWIPFGIYLFDWVEPPPIAGLYLGVPLRLADDRVDQDTNQKEVILEDALNLAEALEQAFADYEPIRLPLIYYLFDDPKLEPGLPPSIGVITELIRFCQSGAFWIETF